jgi:hypothetical protein
MAPEAPERDFERAKGGVRKGQRQALGENNCEQV